jgi:hypothetical protein
MYDGLCFIAGGFHQTPSVVRITRMVRLAHLIGNIREVLMLLTWDQRCLSVPKLGNHSKDYALVSMLTHISYYQPP